MLEKLPTDDSDPGDLPLAMIFDKVTWSLYTRAYIASIANVKPKGWVTIKQRAIKYAKINNCQLAATEGPDSTSLQGFKQHECGNLQEDSDSEDGEGATINGDKDGEGAALDKDKADEGAINSGDEHSLDKETPYIGGNVGRTQGDESSNVEDEKLSSSSLSLSSLSSSAPASSVVVAS